MTDPMRISFEREEADGVLVPEVAKTWSRLTISVGGEPVTAVTNANHLYREGLWVSAYPLAEWLVLNWWTLLYESSPIDMPSARGWQHSSSGSWVRRHSFRAVNGGMPWPDLALASEGEFIRLTWAPYDTGRHGRGIRFVTRGNVLLPRAVVSKALSDYVEAVIDVLREEGIDDTVLQREWDVLRALHDDEHEFAVAAGRLGVDPFTADDALADGLVRLLDEFPADFAAEIIDSTTASPVSLRHARTWVEQALQRAEAGPGGSHPLTAVISDQPAQIDAEHPWRAGYAAARRCREELTSGRVSTSDTSPFALQNIATWTTQRSPSGGVTALTARYSDRLQVVESQPSFASSRNWRRFTTARALGLHVLAPDRTRFVLTDTSVPLQQAARSFAAELLAPGETVVELVDSLGGRPNGRAFDAIGSHLQVGSTVIERQYQNYGGRSSLGPPS